MQIVALLSSFFLVLKVLFQLETGYIGVGDQEQVQLFYYFIKSEKNPTEDPLLIWLTGGPGCSSITGLLFENGPVTFKVDGYNGGTPTLLSTTYSWTKVANIIFLDQPVGSGFSYATTQFLDTPSDSGEAKTIHEFIHKWLSEHKEFISNPFYVSGDSYSGKIIPAMVQEISKGNPVTDTEFEHNQRIPFAHGMALISDELYESLERSCKGNYDNIDPHNTECLKHFDEFLKCNARNAFAPTRRNIQIYYLPSGPMTRACAREALHVVKGSIDKWVRCSSGKPYDSDIKSSVPYHMNNSIRGYRCLIFSGDHDLMAPFISTQAWIRSLNYSIVEKWRPWMIHNQVAGYTQTYANKMTYATVKAKMDPNN
ncbi:hypothetical protein Bca4012_000842 [Brassica carinata]